MLGGYTAVFVSVASTLPNVLVLQLAGVWEYCWIIAYRFDDWRIFDCLRLEIERIRRTFGGWETHHAVGAKSRACWATSRS
jgi:hypothetical protein